MRIGVDIGGTFTDLVAVDDSGTIHLAKSPSTPGDPSDGVIDALRELAGQLGLSLGEVLDATTLFIHGTTIATNILIERKGAKLGLITTQGFRDIMEVRDGTKPDRYNLREPFPEPLIPRSRRLEVPERIRYDGAVETPLDAGAVGAALETLHEAGAEAVVVCFLHAHRNGAHEAAVAKLIEAGRMGGGEWRPYVSLSQAVLAREGEYERLCTASVNAYVGPGLARYLDKLATRLRDEGGRFPLLVMQSSGGVLPADESAQLAVGTLQSGPAGGAMASAFYARAAGHPRMVTFDMGGTSTDIALIQDGAPLERQVTAMDTLRIAAPAVDIVNLGAGGGSIARLDAGGVLRLGPESAGAQPGPACYRRGGDRATLTDANLVLGYISADTFLGGAMSLDTEAARRAVAKDVADPLGIGVEEAAMAVHALANTLIAEGIRAATVRRGLDPRDFSLFGFGGAAGLHAGAVAAELGIPTAVVPSRASVWSALGFLSTDVRHDDLRPAGKSVRDYSPGDIRRLFAEMEEEACRRLAAEGFRQSQMRFVRFADCRYVRQVHALQVEIAEEQLTTGDRGGDRGGDLGWLVEIFEAAYEARYFHKHDDEPVYIDSLRLVAYGSLPELVLPRAAAGAVDPSSAQRGTRRVYAGGWTEAPVYWFDDLAPGMRVPGPASIDSATTSVLVPAGQAARIDPFGSLEIG